MVSRYFFRMFLTSRKHMKCVYDYTHTCDYVLHIYRKTYTIYHMYV